MAHNIPCGIIAIGNPGSGKSTVLNSLAHEVLFKSGMSFGIGLPYQLDKETNKYGTFYDTPGLADDTLRKAAAVAIRNALREGGPFKLLFFITQDGVRVIDGGRVKDRTTMKLVLDAIPEVENNYGIVINQVHKTVARVVNWSAFLTLSFDGIDENRRCAPSNIMFIGRMDELEGADDTLIDVTKLRDVNGMTFDEFVYNQVPDINLTSRHKEQEAKLKEQLRKAEGDKDSKGIKRIS